MSPDVDLLIVGAGISGIGAAVHFTQNCPSKSYTIIENRENIGGTWDLFRYPGIRSDSDMYTFGYKFKPWTNPKAIADGDSILEYLNETIDEFDVRRNIRFGHKCISADWSTPDAMWTVNIETANGPKQITCRFLFMCAGYYSYENPHNPYIEGEERFKGTVIHPQLWDPELDYTNQKVVIIGSGATAVTLLPAMAEKAAHVTMLQRSPTWIASKPAKDWFANLMNAILPKKLAYKINRAKNVWYSRFVYRASVKNPEKMKQQMLKMTQKELGPDWPLDPDFIPSYNPWDQRLCLVPDSDLFKTLKAGKGAIVTDHIKTITENGIELKSGKTLECDLIVKATGISVIVFGNGEFSVDGQAVNPADTFGYEGMMFSDIPNLAAVFGYINASWTLRADLIAEYVCRIINHMDAAGMRQATPRAPEDMTARPWIDIFHAGYLLRVLDQLPKQGDRDPWLNAQDYKRDKKVFPTKPVDDGHMIFSNPGPANEVSKEIEPLEKAS